MTSLPHWTSNHNNNAYSPPPKAGTLPPNRIPNIRDLTPATRIRVHRARGSQWRQPRSDGPQTVEAVVLEAVSGAVWSVAAQWAFAVAAAVVGNALAIAAVTGDSFDEGVLGVGQLLSTLLQPSDEDTGSSLTSPHLTMYFQALTLVSLVSLAATPLADLFTPTTHQKRVDCDNHACITYYSDSGCIYGLERGSYRPDYSGACFRFDSFSSIHLSANTITGLTASYSDGNCQSQIADSGNIYGRYCLENLNGARSSPELETIHRGLQLSSSNSGLDVGTGTPGELLRESQLTQTLVLLYFHNFNDIHFMFDQTIFLRRFVLGDVPKMLLYAVMALGIRYSHAPFQSPHLRPHWGEALYHQARQLLKDEFDRPSVTTIQVHVLLATYKMTFGGTRQAWIFLSFARSFMGILKLDQPASDMDPVQAELCRRLVATIALMENTFPSYLDSRSFLPISLPRIYSEDEFDMIKNSALPTRPKPCLTQEILSLSEIYREAYQLFASDDRLDLVQQRLSAWHADLPGALEFTEANLQIHQQTFTLRPFAYMHLLHAHISQLALFNSMDWSAAIVSPSSQQNSPALPIYTQAFTITDMVQKLSKSAQDLHNPCFGQIVNTALIVLTHHLLTTADASTMAALQVQLCILRDCLLRVKVHCRLYNWVFDQAEWFLRICTQDGFWLDGERWTTILRSQVLSLGTSYERLDYETAGEFYYLRPFHIYLPPFKRGYS
ncbi:hypothetical protein BJX99DRAFT_257894 [Aspergillus californicus]